MLAVTGLMRCFLTKARTLIFFILSRTCLRYFLSQVEREFAAQKEANITVSRAHKFFPIASY